MSNRKDDVRIQIAPSDQERLISTHSQKVSSPTPPAPNPDQSSSKTTPKSPQSFPKLKLLIFAEFFVFASIVVLLISSLKADRLKYSEIWGLRLWKWSLLMMAVVSGRLIASMFVIILISFIWKLWLNEKVLYFVYGVKRSFLVFIWICLVFLTWVFLFDRHGAEANRTKETIKTMHDITKGLAGCLIGVAIWLLKTLLIKLVGSLHAEQLFKKIKEAITNRKILMDLSNSTRDEGGDKKPDKKPDNNKSEIMKEWIAGIRVQKLFSLYYTFQDDKGKTEWEEIVDEKPDNESKIMKELIAGIRVKKLFSLSYAIQNDKETERKEIVDESEAREAADSIFERLAKPDDESSYMEMSTLSNIVKDEKVIQHFEEVKEEAGIKKSSFRKWVVKIYNDHKFLNDTLKYSKTAMDELNLLASGVVLMIDAVVFLFLMGLLTTKLLLFISSQLLLMAFMFKNMARTVFEAIIFVFLMHPYDVGDRCVIDGVQMVVEEMSILNTIFLRYDGEKIYYPNSVLSVKPISNLYRSPPMTDSLEFAIDVKTPMGTIDKLQEKIKEYLESNPRHWRRDHSIQFREIENVNKMKMVIFINHTINFHYVDKRMSRRSAFVLQMKTIFEELKIEYQLLPQQVHLHNVHQSVV